MFLKKFKKFLVITLITTFIMPLNIFAYSDYIIAGGENIGIRLNGKGILIAGFYKVNNSYPGKDCNLEKGDIIVKADDKTINTLEDLVSVIKNSNQKSLKLIYVRNKEEKITTLNLANDAGIIKTGLYVKDSVSGIGTLTFIDPKTKLYGALGHEVIESNTGVMIDVKDGKIYNSVVTSIDKSTRGDPGSKNATTDSNSVYGNVKENTKAGIFGDYTKEFNTNKLYKVSPFEAIDLGEAEIITVLSNNVKMSYKINIIKVNNDKNDNKNILFEVTDKDLIGKSGGIVQGMSGSPIIQNDNIIGAVTNVVVNNPTRGYGILITTMLEEAEN
ncbi:MAG: SpoIVB peptidase S55 domain-containing protein [Bacilli bacterium]